MPLGRCVMSSKGHVGAQFWARKLTSGRIARSSIDQDTGMDFESDILMYRRCVASTRQSGVRCHVEAPAVKPIRRGLH